MNKTCSTCIYGSRNKLGDIVCANAYSDQCTEWVDEDMACDKWEGAANENL